MTIEAETPPEAEPKGITPEPLVDLDAEENEQMARFGGKLYTVRSINDFGIAKQQRLNRDGREFFKLFNSDEELTETDEQRLEMLVDRMVNEVLNAPVTVRKKLSDAQKARVVLGFTQAPLLQALQAMAAAQKAREETPEEPISEG